MPSRLIAPAPASNQTHIPIPSKVPSHITVTIESSIAPTPSIPVATISGQQVRALLFLPLFLFNSNVCFGSWLNMFLFCFFSKGHSGNLHHLMPANIQIIRGQISAPTVSPQTFTSHLPRGKLFSYHQNSHFLILEGLMVSYCAPRSCCCSCYVQLQNGLATSHWSRCRAWPACSATHHPPGHSGT